MAFYFFGGVAMFGLTGCDDGRQGSREADDAAPAIELASEQLNVELSTVEVLSDNPRIQSSRYAVTFVDQEL